MQDNNYRLQHNTIHTKVFFLNNSPRPGFGKKKVEFSRTTHSIQKPISWEDENNSALFIGKN